MASIVDEVPEVPASQNLFEDEVPASQALLPASQNLIVDDHPASPDSPKDDQEDSGEETSTTRYLVRFKTDENAVTAASSTPEINDDDSDTDDDGDQSVASLHEKPVDRRAMRRVMMKEFFVRAFLAKRYCLPTYISYEALMRLVTVEVFGNREAVWQVNVALKPKLLDYLVNFYREQPEWFYSLLIKDEKLAIIRAKQQRLDNIVKAFLNIGQTN